MAVRLGPEHSAFRTFLLQITAWNGVLSQIHFIFSHVLFKKWSSSARYHELPSRHQAEPNVIFRLSDPYLQPRWNPQCLSASLTRLPGLVNTENDLFIPFRNFIWPILIWRKQWSLPLLTCRQHYRSFTRSQCPFPCVSCRADRVTWPYCVSKATNGPKKHAKKL